MNSRELVELCKKMQQGDSEAFARLYQECYVPIFRFLYGLTLRREEAEDLTQETFLKLPQALNHFTEGNVLAWLMTIARNMFYDSLRKQKGTFPLEEEHEEVAREDGLLEETDEILDHEADQEELIRVLAVLSISEREILVLRYWEDRNLKEIALLVGKSHEAVRKEMSRTLKKLKTLIKNDGKQTE